MTDFQYSFLPGQIHLIAPVNVQPVTVMFRWRLFQVESNSGRSRHLVGRADHEGRVSSAIMNFDLKNLRATTQSGRVYELAGLPGYDDDALYVFNRWILGLGITGAKDMTRAVIRLTFGER